MKFIYKHLGICILLGILISCSSTPDKAAVAGEGEIGLVHTKDLSAPRADLLQLLGKPDSYVNKELAVMAVVDSVHVRKVGNDLSLLIVNVRPVGAVPLNAPPAPSPFQRVLQELVQANEVISAGLGKDIFISRTQADRFRNIAYDLKIAACEVRATNRSLQAAGKKEVAETMEILCKAYESIAEAYFIFADTATRNSPSLDQPNAELGLAYSYENSRRFEKATQKAAQHLLSSAELLCSGKNLLHQPSESFDWKRIPQMLPYDILAYGDRLSASSWQYGKKGRQMDEINSRDLSQAYVKMGVGFKSLNESFVSLGKHLDSQGASLLKNQSRYPILRCAYYGFNGSHLRKTAVRLQRFQGAFPLALQGTLVKENLREEVGIVWLRLQAIKADGMTFTLGYGDESGTLRKALEIADWVQEVKKEGE